MAPIRPAHYLAAWFFAVALTHCDSAPGISTSSLEGSGTKKKSTAGATVNGSGGSGDASRASKIKADTATHLSLAAVGAVVHFKGRIVRVGSVLKHKKFYRFVVKLKSGRLVVLRVGSRLDGSLRNMLVKGSVERFSANRSKLNHDVYFLRRVVIPPQGDAVANVGPIDDTSDVANDAVPDAACSDDSAADQVETTDDATTTSDDASSAGDPTAAEIDGSDAADGSVADGSGDGVTVDSSTVRSCSASTEPNGEAVATNTNATTTAAPPTIPAGFFWNGPSGYAANAQGHFCIFTSWPMWIAAGGPDGGETAVPTFPVPSADGSSGYVGIYDGGCQVAGFHQTTLAVNQNLVRGDRLWSANGCYFLDMQTDGNLVLYAHLGGYNWTSATGGTAGDSALMQGDGNFVLSGAATPWSTITKASGKGCPSNGCPQAQIIMQDDGNLVIYSNSNGAFPAVLWASNTGRTPGASCTKGILGN